jgi:hypothetical protein
MKQILFLLLGITFIFGFDLKPTKTTILEVNNQKAIVDLGDLKIGQSGIVVHQFENNKKIILNNAIVTNTNEKNSTISFLNEEVILQNAIPSSNLTPQKDDSFIVNHLYDTTLLVAPNFEVNKKVKTIFYNLKYIETDTLAGFLKINNMPVPDLKIFQRFAKENNIGLILFIVKNNLHILDTLSLKILDSFPITYKDRSSSLPFYTNVEGIETGVFNFFEEKTIKDYHKYYTKLLGLNDDGK